MAEPERIALDRIDRCAMDFDALLHDPDRANALRTDLLRESFLEHTTANAGYRAYAEALDVDPDNREIAIEQIPLLPSSLFKRRDLDLASVKPEAVVKSCVSSGTMGSRSVVPRDEATLASFLTSTAAAIPALFEVERPGSYRGLVLGPDTKAAGALWFAYATACVNVVVPSEHLERNGFSAAMATQRLRETMSEDLHVAIVGPPQRVLEVSEVAAANPRWPGLSADSFVITGGGWKDIGGQRIAPAEFRATVQRNLKLVDQTQIRDSFNMVELNSVIHECPAHEKHVPPWVGAHCRDPETNAPLPAGSTGILAFLDATARSYPGFILSEDFGTVFDGRCRCGRSGQRLEVTRRLTRLESRGCALKMSAGDTNRSRDRFLQSAYRDESVDQHAQSR